MQEKKAPAQDGESAEKSDEAVAEEPKGKLVYVLRIDEQISEALLYYFRRGIKEAQSAEADVLILDMNTPGGRVDITEEMMDLLRKFEPHDQTYTYVNKDAISAGSFISCATKHIYFAPDGVMGAAAPVMGGGQDIPETMQLKVNSVLRAKIRATAEFNGHRAEVFEAMIDPAIELKIGDEVIKPEGEILTLTASEAAKTYGKPPTPLLSEGTVATVDELIEKVAGPDARVVKVEATGYEKIATYITFIAPVLFSAGLILGYLEMQTPGFGLFGTAAIVCLLVFFFGHYVAGLGGNEAMLVFFLGVLLVAVEIFLLPGFIIFGVLGAGMMLGALLWSMIDRFPNESIIPSMEMLRLPLYNMGISLVLTVLGIGTIIALAPKVVRKTGFEGADTIGSGRGSTEAPAGGERLEVGATGEAITPLHPSGSVRFGEKLVDVVSDGRLIAKGTQVKISQVQGMEIVVVPAEPVA